MTDRLEGARAALARGDVLVAYDLAHAVLEADNGALEARWIEALALARGGSSEQARRAVDELRRRLDAGAPATKRMREDVDALVARLAKDRAFAAAGEERARLAIGASELYEAVAQRYGGSYSFVNAATLRAIGGDGVRARELAQRARASLASERPQGVVDEYWHAATEAESALVLGETAAARLALARAASLAVDDVAARAVTCRQLRLLCAATGVEDDILDVLSPPSVLHYCGHRMDAASTARRFPAEFEERVASDVAEFLDTRSIGFAFGSLASGTDIIVAELLLDRGVEVNVVLPFDADEFELISVADAGAEWSERYRSCLQRAATVRHASDSAFLGDRGLFGYASRIAMGQAVSRARGLGVAAEQLAVWDGAPEDPIAGTAHDIAMWERAGLPTHVIPLTRVGEARSDAPPGESFRVVRAIIFGDFRGFSRLHDEQFPAFVSDVLGAIAPVLQRYDAATVYRNSWGDAIVLVLDDVLSAAGCALEIQSVIAGFDFAGSKLPSDLALRVGAHVGPVAMMHDPVRGVVACWGRELTRAARIEPRTPEGEVYVTDAFAALLALEPDSQFAVEYVGRVETAKQFETIPMYRLREVS